MKECKRVECMGNNGCIDKCWNPQRTWVGLTDEEIDDLSRTMVKGNKSVNWLCQAIEAKLKEKNT